MNALINAQIINNEKGLPAFAVIPYAVYQSLLDKSPIDLSNGVPSAVVDAVFDNNISALKAWREHLELTQSEVAKRAGMTQSAYSQHENADKLRKPTREKLAKALGLTAEQLNF